MIVDAHVHVMSFPAYADLGDKIATTQDLIAFRSRHPDVYQRAEGEDPVDNSDDLIAAMDRNGVGHAVVQSRPGPVTNDHIAGVVARHPGRLSGLFSFGMDHQMAGFPDDPSVFRRHVVDQIPRCVEELGLKGMGEMTIRSLTAEIHPEAIARDLRPIFEQLEHYELPILIQTAWTQFKGGLWYGDPLWVDEVAGRHPGVKIVLTKMGRGIQTYFDHALTVALRNDSVYFDTVGTSPEHLRTAIDAIGSHRIMFGTDWSATWRWVREPADVYALRLRVVEDARLTDDEREDVLWRTASQLYGLADPRTSMADAAGA